MKLYILVLLIPLIILSSRAIKAKSVKNHNLTPTFSKSKNTSKYVKNPITPKFLYVISQDKMTSSERTMIASLQGIVNPNSSSHIYTLNSSQPDYKIWLDDLKNNYKIPYKIISNPWELLNLYKNYIDGYVLYSHKNPKDPSINNACSYASLNNCIVVDEAIQDKLLLYDIKNLKYDCRNTDKNWAYNNLWNNGLNHFLVIELSPEKDSPLRDYALMAKSLVFYEDSVDDTSLREKVFSSVESNSICLGWGPDEFTNVGIASKYGVGVVAADWSYNLTVLSSFPSLPKTQKISTDIPKEKSAHYVTFIMSDGDNQQWYLGSNYGSPNWYGSPYKGKFNLGWSIGPSLYYLAPTVFNLYYENANHGKVNYYFLVPPSGNSYIYPSKFKKTALNDYIETLNDYMIKVDQEYVAIIDDNSFYNKKLWNEFTIKSNIKGLFYLDYSRHDNYHGKIIWSNNKPIVSCRNLLWKGLENEDDLVKKINERVSLGQTDQSNPNSYTFVYVHAWSKNLSDVKKVVDALNKNEKVKVVNPKTFMELIEKNIKH
ncbi:GxGYxYP domain-containing protein [Hathewaya histolytica]|uniref:GxGYxYP domain-containing protein n=1 Tax=Hathewaya histolytica TaxID=1498 RepID=UPI003B66C1E0